MISQVNTGSCAPEVPEHRTDTGPTWRGHGRRPQALNVAGAARHAANMDHVGFKNKNNPRRVPVTPENPSPLRRAAPRILGGAKIRLSETTEAHHNPIGPRLLTSPLMETDHSRRNWLRKYLVRAFQNKRTLTGSRHNEDRLHRTFSAAKKGSWRIRLTLTMTPRIHINIRRAPRQWS